MGRGGLRVEERSVSEATRRVRETEREHRRTFAAAAVAFLWRLLRSSSSCSLTSLSTSLGATKLLLSLSVSGGVPGPSSPTLTSSSAAFLSASSASHLLCASLASLSRSNSSTTVLTPSTSYPSAASACLRSCTSVRSA